VRDAETQDAIRRTAGVALPPRGGAALTLRVTKSRYRLDVLRDGVRLKTYPIAMGGQPVGAKRRRGDNKTPEGEYVLIPHHQSPSFGPCFYVCYPKATDAARGRRDGLITEAQRVGILRDLKRGRIPNKRTRLGGDILLHATHDRVPGLTRDNWTLGCIAMEYDHVHELLGAYRPADRPVLEIWP